MLAIDDPIIGRILFGLMALCTVDMFMIAWRDKSISSAIIGFAEVVVLGMILYRWAS